MELGRSTSGDAASINASNPAPVAAPEDAPDLPGAHRRVLVCDDSEQIRRLIRVNLELEGYEVIEGVDGEAAMETLQDTSQPLPDVITVDVVMPRRDGWSMVSAIRADPRLQHIPIVMVTASAQEADRAHADQLAVNEFVAKPFEPEDLLTRIEALADGRRP
jgi:CheY-like chemotaxis protein